jgi:hypothetical protein
MPALIPPPDDNILTGFSVAMASRSTSATTSFQQHLSLPCCSPSLSLSSSHALLFFFSFFLFFRPAAPKTSTSFLKLSELNATPQGHMLYGPV